MTDKSKIAFEDFYYKSLNFQSSQHRFRDMCISTIKDVVQEKDRNSAENAVIEALKPFREEQEREIYKAAKKFVEAYEANDLNK